MIIENCKHVWITPITYNLSATSDGKVRQTCAKCGAVRMITPSYEKPSYSVSWVLRRKNDTTRN